MSAKDAKLVIGGSPRADLLPPEIKIEERVRGQRRGLVLVIIVVVVLIGAGYAFAAITAQTAQDRLTAANNRTTELLAEQAKYVEVRQLMAELDSIQDAQQIGISTEIQWAGVVGLIDQALPGSVGWSKLTVSSASPIADFSLPGSPLEGLRVAEVKLEVFSTTLFDKAQLLDNLSAVPGYVDASVTNIAGVPGAGYSAMVTLHLGADILTLRTSPTDDEDELFAAREAELQAQADAEAEAEADSEDDE